MIYFAYLDLVLLAIWTSIKTKLSTIDCLTSYGGASAEAGIKYIMLYSSLLKIDRLISNAVIQILWHALPIMAANEAVV